MEIQLKIQTLLRGVWYGKRKYKGKGINKEG